MATYDLILTFLFQKVVAASVRKYGVEDDQELEYCGGFKAQITSLSLEKYSPPHVVAIGLMTILPQDTMKPL